MFFVQAVTRNSTGFLFSGNWPMGISQAPSCTYKLYRPQRKRPKGILKYEFQNDLLPFDFSVLSNVLINSFSFSIF